MRRTFPLALIVLAAGLSSPQAADGDADDKAIHDLTQRFFAAYAAKDLDAFMALWSEMSPDYAPRKKTMTGLFAATGLIELKSLAVVRVRLDTDAASVRVRVQVGGNDLKTGKPHPLLGALDRVLDLARAAGGWKVMRYGPSDVRLMDRLEEAKSKAQRLRLLDDDSDLVGPDFIQLILKKGNNESKQGQFARTSRLQDVAQEIAVGLGDADNLGGWFCYRGMTLDDQGCYEPALRSYREALRLFRGAGDRAAEASVLGNIGTVYGSMGRYKESLQNHQDALQIKRDLGDRDGEANMLNNIAAVYCDTGRYKEALQCYQEALKIRRDLGDRAGEAKTLCDTGTLYLNTSRYKEALQQFQEVLPILRDLGNRRGEADALIGIGVAYAYLGRYKEALHNDQDALKIRRDLGDRRGEAEALSNIGRVYEEMSQYKDALGQYQNAFKIRHDLGDRGGEAHSLINLGTINKRTGRYEEALRQFQDALQVKRDIGDRDGEGQALNNIAGVYDDLGRYPEALRHYQDALRLTRDIGNPNGEASILSNIGVVYDDMGRFADALRQYQAALPIRRAIGDRNGEATTLSNMGQCYSDTGRYAESLRYEQDALKIRRAIGDRDGEAATLNNIGAVYVKAGRYAEALQWEQDALKILREIGDRNGEGITLNNIAVVYDNMGRYTDALRQYKDALKNKRDLGVRAGEANTLANIGVVYAETGRYEDALQQYRDALKIRRDIGDVDGEAITLQNIGTNCLHLGRYAEALENLNKGLGIAESTGDRNIAQGCSFFLGKTYQAQKQWRQAADAYGQAARNVEQLRSDAREPSLQTSFLAQKSGTYFLLGECLLELDESGKAFAASEAAKARGLVDILRRGKADIRAGMSDDEHKQEQVFQERLTALGVQLEDLRSRKADADRQAALARDLGRARRALEDFHRDLFVHRPDLEARRAEFAPASLDDLGALFAGRPGLVVLSYLIGDDETLLFVLTAGDRPGGPARLTVHRIDVGSKDLAEAVDAFRSACADPAAAAPDSQELYRWLIAPAADELRDAKQVVVVPDGVLHTLPFQALQDPYSTFLVERLAVSYAPSLTALAKMEELGAARRKQYAGKPPSLLAIGVSDFGRREKPLPAAEKEARAVADAFGDGAKLLPGAQATWAAVQASWSGRRYLHFATHGRLNPDAPLYSALVLSPGDANDGGVLYAEDLVNADVPAELAVMSACETGLGRRVGGEGLLGLSWSWFAAGVPSTVASQWSVGDASTARLMKAFYGRLAAGDSKAEALRQAELALLKDDATRHPFYWAPFVLVGDDR